MPRLTRAGSTYIICKALNAKKLSNALYSLSKKRNIVITGVQYRYLLRFPLDRITASTNNNSNNNNNARNHSYFSSRVTLAHTKLKGFTAPDMIGLYYCRSIVELFFFFKSVRLNWSRQKK